jgi:4,5-DOPA dioxygenase extradiol
LFLDEPGQVFALCDHQDFEPAVPTNDHFIPLLYVAALAAASNETPELLTKGYAYGALSMASITAGANPIRAVPARTDDGQLAGPDIVPPDQSII